MPMLPIHHPEFWERLPILAVMVFMAVRCLSLFFRHVMGIPYPTSWEIVLNILTTGALAIFFVPDFMASAKLAAILLGGSAWGTWAEGRARHKKAQKDG